MEWFHKNPNWKSISVHIVLLWMLLIGSPQPVMAGESYKISVLPEYLDIVIYNGFSRLISYLEKTVNVSFELVIPRNFEEHIQFVKEGTVDFSYQNSYVFLMIWPYCEPLVIAETHKKWGIENRGLIIAKKDGRIEKLGDLRGKKISIVSYYSAAGFVAQQNLLRGMLDLSKDVTIIEASENLHEAVVIDVMEKRADAGFVAEGLIVRGGPLGGYSSDDLKNLTVIAHTGYMPNWILTGSKKVKKEIRDLVRSQLLKIPVGGEEVPFEGIRRFVPVPANYLEEYHSRIKGE